MLFSILNNLLSFVVKVNGGREGRPIGAAELAKAVEELGAGEILLNCIDCDGMNNAVYPEGVSIMHFTLAINCGLKHVLKNDSKNLLIDISVLST